MWWLRTRRNYNMIQIISNLFALINWVTTILQNHYISELLGKRRKNYQIKWLSPPGQHTTIFTQRARPRGAGCTLEMLWQITHEHTWDSKQTCKPQNELPYQHMGLTTQAYTHTLVHKHTVSPALLSAMCWVHHHPTVRTARWARVMILAVLLTERPIRRSVFPRSSCTTHYFRRAQIIWSIFCSDTLLERKASMYYVWVFSGLWTVCVSGLVVCVWHLKNSA